MIIQLTKHVIHRCVQRSKVDVENLPSIVENAFKVGGYITAQDGSRYVPHSYLGKDFWLVTHCEEGRWVVRTMFDQEPGTLAGSVFYSLPRAARRHPRTVKALAEMNGKLIRAGKRYDPIKFLIEDTSNPRWK